MKNETMLSDQGIDRGDLELLDLSDHEHTGSVMRKKADLADQRNAAIAAARLTKFAASLTRSSMLRDIETVRNAGGGRKTAAVPHLLTELQKELMTILDAWEEKR